VVPKPAEDTFVWVVMPPDGLVTGTIYTDGSRLDGKVAILAVNGWAFVAVDDNGTVTAIARVIPPPWITDIPGAEAWAVFQAARRRAPNAPLRIDCEPCVTAIHRGLKWATAGRRKHARVNALLLTALDDTPNDLVVWMPAHTTQKDIGVKKLGNGELLTGRDLATNGLADFHAKEMAGLVRVPKPTREQVLNYLGTVKEAARWVGEINYTANHRDDPPFRDSVASRALALKARIGRSKTKAQRIAPMIVPRPACLGGHDLHPVNDHDGGKRGKALRCRLCRLTSAKPTFCRTRCKGSAATRWAEALKQMADNSVQDGGGHTRFISGDVIWCGVCGAYADLKVSGLVEKCTLRHTGPWNGGGKRGQLNSLRKNRHPRTRILLPLPIAESTMTLDEAAGASHAQLAEAADRMARYSARDKATARANAHRPFAAPTDEKRQWIHNKRSKAIQRAARKRAQHEIPVPVSRWAPPIRES